MMHYFDIKRYPSKLVSEENIVYTALGRLFEVIRYLFIDIKSLP